MSKEPTTPRAEIGDEARAMIERLRETGPKDYHNGTTWVGKPHNRDGDEAADLIERLAFAAATPAPVVGDGPINSDWAGDWQGDTLTDRAASLAATPASVTPDAGEGRLYMFLEILSAAGGQSDAGDWPGAWINAFCEAHEGRAPDTFNLAINRGYARSTHDSDSDHSVVYLTDSGRSFLSVASQASHAKKGEAS